MPPISPPRVRAEIDLAALSHNLDYAYRHSAKRLMAVVKANAYGHGLLPVVKQLVKHPKLAFFGVANVGEARQISDNGIDTPIYLLGPTWAEEREEVVARKWVPCLSSIEEARHFSRLAAAAQTRLRCHLVIDVGMGRAGFDLRALVDKLPEIEALPGLEIDGLGAHFPGADEDPAATRQQCVRFRDAVDALGGAARYRWLHLGNSAGLLGYDLAPTNLVRPGLLVYGVSPLVETQHAENLRTTMTLKAHISLIRTVAPGHGISYGSTFITARPSRIATVGIGYADGYPRQLSGQGAEVFIRGQRFPLVGRVTMDQIMVDVSDAKSEIREGDEVELFGPNIPVTEIAQKAGTITWDIFTGIGSRVVRQYLK